MSQSTQVTASLTVTSRDGFLYVRDDESGKEVARIPSDTTITASTDSHAVVSEVESALVGPVVSVDHDKDSITVVIAIPVVGLDCSEPTIEATGWTMMTKEKAYAVTVQETHAHAGRSI